MTEQQGNPRTSVALAIVLVVVAILAFAAAFYFLDGYSLVEGLLGSTSVQAADGSSGTEATGSAPVPPEPAAESLVLPDGMPEEFALRLWQEQVDSQKNVRKLLSGEVTELTVTGRESSEDVSVLSVQAEFADGTSAPGTVGMRRFGDIWYFAYVTGMRRVPTNGIADSVSEGDGGSSSTPLPSIDDVDVALLNTMIAQQGASAEITERYANGAVKSVTVRGTQPGTNSQAIDVEMSDASTTVSGQVIGLVSSEDTGEMWFVARFTGSDDTGS